MPKICPASGSFSSSLASRQSCRCKVRERRYSLFLDPEPEITTQPSRRDLPLMAHKSNATMLWPRRRNQPAPESSAVDKAFRALLLCAVKGGVSCHQTSYLRFSRFNRSLFFRLRFFITYLTLPLSRMWLWLSKSHEYAGSRNCQRMVSDFELLCLPAAQR